MASAILAEAEKMLIETSGRRLVLSEIARRMDISQPYIHSFFKTKSDLIRALAQKWFETVEEISHSITHSDAPAKVRLEDWLIGVLRLKRDKFDEDPLLYQAYLELAGQHMDLVATHTTRLTDDLRSILSNIVPPGHLEEAVALIEDATVLFRVPFNIARFRARATDDRARTVLRALLPALKQMNTDGETPKTTVK